MKSLSKLSLAVMSVVFAAATATSAQAATDAELQAALEAARQATAAAQAAQQAALQAQKAAEAAQARANAAELALKQAQKEAQEAKTLASTAATNSTEALTSVKTMASNAPAPQEGGESAQVAWKPSFDFHGYFRAGVGKSRNDANITWQKEKLGRLGNEYDTYGELEFGSEVYRLNDVSFYLDSMVSLVSDGSNDNERTSDDSAEFGFRQFNLQVKGLIPGDKNAVLWAGKRYYQRHDIHIIDTKYWNVSGSGAGLEYLTLGPGTMSLAWIRADSNGVDYRYEDGLPDDVVSGNLNVNYFDARYAGFRPWQGAWTEFGIDVAVPDETDGKTAQSNHAERDLVYDNGTSVMLTAELSQDMFGGYNKTVLQYFTGGLAHNATDIGGGWYDSWNDTEDAWGFSIINTGEIPVTNNFSFTHVLHYGYESESEAQENLDSKHSFRAVARGSYQLTQYTRMLAEVGMFADKAEYDGADSQTARGQKYTLAYAIAPGKEILSRPELRFYVSYINSSDGEDISNNSGSASYDDNWNFGIQAEAWW